MPPMKFKKRSWSEEYLQAKEKLCEISSHLENQTKGLKDFDKAKYTPTDIELRELGIELSEIDFKTGETSASAFPYFAPSSDEVFCISNSGIDLAEDTFNRFRDRRTSWFLEKRSWPGRLHKAFSQYYYTLMERQQPKFNQHWEYIPWSSSLRWTGQRAYYDTRIYEAMQARRSSQSHRVISMITGDSDPDDNRPSIFELFGLVSWILGAMRHRLEQVQVEMSKKSTKSQRKELRKKRPHIVFPVLVLSFAQPARVRILYRYVKNGILKVQSTTCENFNVPNYVEKMDCLLRWTFPTTNGDTRLIGLQAISEDEEEPGESGDGLAKGTDDTTSRKDDIES